MINGDEESSPPKDLTYKPIRSPEGSKGSKHRTRQPSIKTSHFKDCAIGRKSSFDSIGQEARCPMVKSSYTFGTKTNVHAHCEKYPEGGLAPRRDSDHMRTSLAGLTSLGEMLPSSGERPPSCCGPNVVESIQEKGSYSKQSLSDQKPFPSIDCGMSRGFVKGMITTFESEGYVTHPTKYAGLKREIRPKAKTDSRGNKLSYYSNCLDNSNHEDSNNLSSVESEELVQASPVCDKTPNSGEPRQSKIGPAVAKIIKQFLGCESRPVWKETRHNFFTRSIANLWRKSEILQTKEDQ